MVFYLSMFFLYIFGFQADLGSHIFKFQQQELHCENGPRILFIYSSAQTSCLNRAIFTLHQSVEVTHGTLLNSVGAKAMAFIEEMSCPMALLVVRSYKELGEKMYRKVLM